MQASHEQKQREEVRERCQCATLRSRGPGRKEIEATWVKWVRGDAGGHTVVCKGQWGSERRLLATSPFLPPSGVSTGSQWVQGEGPWLLTHATRMW